MIPKKQLEKEIEELKGELSNEVGEELNDITLEQIEKKEATLTQTNQIINLIEEAESFTIDINGKLVGNKEPYQSGWSGDWIKKEELLTKIKGDGE